MKAEKRRKKLPIEIIWELLMVRKCIESYISDYPSIISPL